MYRLLLFILFAPLFVQPAAYPDGTVACDGIAWPHASQDQVLPPLSEGERHCHAVSIHTAGRWLINVRVEASASVQPRLLLPTTTCDLQQPVETSLRVLHRMPTSAFLEVATPGRYGFCVAANDPQAPLGAYRLTSWFTPSPTGAKSDPDEDEPDPDPVVTLPEARCVPLPSSTKVRDVPPSWFGCANVVLDDHADGWACATPLSPRDTIEATLRAADNTAAWLDEDHFRFDVATWRTVVLRAESQADLAAALYAADGQRLATDYSKGESGEVRIVRMLGPGTYFLRISARDPGSSPYRLTVTEVE